MLSECRSEIATNSYALTGPLCVFRCVLCPDLHNSVPCSCRSAVATTCPSLDCKTPQRPNCSCHRLLPPHTVSCLQHTHLKTDTGWRKMDTHTRSTSHLSPSDGQIIFFTCVASTHVHVSYLPPGVGGWVINLTALPHQRTVVSPYCVQ